MRNPHFRLCENEGAYQLCSNCTNDQRLYFRNTDSTITPLQFLSFNLPALFFDCTDRFMSDLFGNPEDRFSRVAAQMHIDV